MCEQENLAIVAAAGTGKTQYIVQAMKQENYAKTLAITFTQEAQSVLRSRISESMAPEAAPGVEGWYKFLLDNVLYPYLPCYCPEIRLTGMKFEPAGPNNWYAKGNDRYFTRDGRVYSNEIGFVANQVIKKSGSMVMDRLSEIYDSIYFDEFQDLVGNDLEIVNQLLESKIKITIVCDPRQAVFVTSKSDRKNKKYQGPNISRWFEDRKKSLESRKEINQQLRITYLTVSHRFQKSIAAFSNEIYTDKSKYRDVTTDAEYEEADQGVFLVSKVDFLSYAERYKKELTLLRYSKTTEEELMSSLDRNEYEILNYGEAKGITRNRVIVIPTEEIRKLLSGEIVELAPKSSCGFYIAATRAKLSLAILVENAEETLNDMKSHGSRFLKDDIHIQVWRKERN